MCDFNLTGIEGFSIYMFYFHFLGGITLQGGIFYFDYTDPLFHFIHLFFYSSMIHLLELLHK